MATYDKPVRLLMREMVSEKHIVEGQIIRKEEVHAWFSSTYPKIKSGTISAHLIRMSTNATSRVHHNIDPNGDDDLFFKIDSQQFRLFNSEIDPDPIYKKRDSEPIGEDDEGLMVEQPSEFAYEKDLKNFLAKNLHLLAPSLKLFEDEGITGIEFPVGGRFVDILAVDENNNFVVIELKVSRGYDRVIGQLLRYIGWIEKNFADPEQIVKGMIVAREISEDLILATSKINEVELFEYSLSVTLERVE